MALNVSRQTPFSAFIEAKTLALAGPPPRLPGQPGSLDRLAFLAEQESIREVRKAKRDLYVLKLPFSGLVGTMLYELWTNLNPETRIIKDFLGLLQAHQDTETEIRRAFAQAARDGNKLGPEANTVLSQLQDSLKSGNSVSQTVRYMQEAHRLGLTAPGLSDAMQRYVQSADRIFANRPGLKGLADEPIIHEKILKMTKGAAGTLALTNREDFFQRIFGKLLSGGTNLPELMNAFRRLETVQFRTARLISIGAAVAMGAYFTLENEVKLKRIYARGL